MVSENYFPIISENNSESFLYKWYVEFFDGDDAENKEKKVFPVNTEKITKLCQYKSHVSPVLTGQFRVKRTDVIKLNAIKKSCLCTITVKKLIYVATKSGTDTSYSLQDEKIVFSSTFIPVFDPKTFKNLREDKIQEEESKPKVSDPTPGVTTIYTTFFNMTSQKIFKQIFNNVIEGGGTVGSILGWVLSELNVRYIADMPTGDHSLPDIVIPPMNTIQVLNYLQSSVGIYENGLETFYDFDDILYILDKYALDHEHVDSDTVLTHIYVNQGSNVESGAGDILHTKNKNDEAMYIGSPLINYETAEVMDSELRGDTFIFSSFTQSINAVGYDENGNPVPDTVRPLAQAMMRSNSGHTQSGTKFIVDYDELNNPVNMASYFNEMESRAQTMSVALNRVDIQDFKPNKLIELHFKDTTLNNVKGGIYFLNSVQFDFTQIVQAQIFKEGSDVNEYSKLGYEPTKTACGCVLSLSRKNPSSN